MRLSVQPLLNIKMKQNLPGSRHTIMWAVILCYLLPFIGLSAYGALASHALKNWNLLSLGLLFSSMGSLAIFLLLTRWERAWSDHLSTSQETAIPEEIPLSPYTQAAPQEQIVSEQALKETQQTNNKLASDIETLLEELRQLGMEKERFQQQAQKAGSELEACKLAAYHELDQHKAYINDLQSSLAEQKGLIDKKQQQITLLETKVSDLTYEIKTLLQIAERHSETLSSSIQESDYTYSVAATLPESDLSDTQYEKQVHTAEEASRQLKRCLDIAQKITGSNRFNSQMSSFLDSPADSFALDLRRLCDTLRSESNSTILLYSPKENQALFANNQVKTLTGWSPEKFVQNFNEILDNSLQDWRQALSSLAAKNETTIKLSIKNKNGQNIDVHSHLGLIPTGIFRNHAIAVIYPQTTCSPALETAER